MLLQTIYLLSLHNNKYFISNISDNKLPLLNTIINSDNYNISNVFNNGIDWLTMYPIINIISLDESLDESLDKTVRDYMFYYGIQNVRGGSYSSVVLNNKDLNIIQNEYDDDYLKMHNTIKDIDLELSKLIQIYKELIEIKEKIEIISNIKICDDDNNDLIIIKDNTICDHVENVAIPFNLVSDTVNDFNLAYNIEYNKNIMRNSVYNLFHEFYEIFDVNDQNTLYFDEDIKWLLFINNILEKKKYEKIIINEYGSEEYITYKIKLLYSKRINLIKEEYAI